MKHLKIMIAALLVIGPISAHADPISEFYWNANFGPDFSWALPTAVGDQSGDFTVDNTAIFVDGLIIDFTDNFNSLFFYTAGNGGGFGSGGIGLFGILDVDLYGAQLFQSGVGFVNGVYNMYASNLESFKGTLTITSKDEVSVPEPGTLALLGLGLVGMGLTRRRKKV